MSKDVTWAIGRAFLHAKGKATPPTAGSKYNQLLAIADSAQKLWSTEPNVEWNSLYAATALTPLVSTSKTYAIPDTVDYIAKRVTDPITITVGTSITTYKLVTASQLYQYRTNRVCAKIGRNLVFPAVFDAASPLIGGTITIPAILKVNDIALGTDIIQVDDPMWIAYAMAAEFDQNDLIKVTNVPHLQDLANLSMQKMLENNGGSVNELVMDWQPAGEEWA